MVAHKVVDLLLQWICKLPNLVRITVENKTTTHTYASLAVYHTCMVARWVVDIVLQWICKLPNLVRIPVDTKTTNNTYICEPRVYHKTCLVAHV